MTYHSATSIQNTYLQHPQPAAPEHGVRDAADDAKGAVRVAEDLADPLEVDVHSELVVGVNRYGTDRT